ncbi:MAG: hypothetical protein N2C14_05980 [Planctomycetales bacterium]
MNLKQQFKRQCFSNEYELVNGVIMHAENGDAFRIPPPVIKRRLGLGHFVELRMDSPRFSVHEDDAEQCACPSCNGKMSKPILRHEHPATLLPLQEQDVPSRGWGEDFWVRTTQRDGQFLLGIVDNPLREARLHGVTIGDEIVFHEDHVLAVHGVHREDLVSGMNEAELRELVGWIESQSE